MIRVVPAFIRAIAQLRDPAILKVLAKTMAITLFLFAAAAIGIWYALAGDLRDRGVVAGSQIGAVLAIVLAIAGGWLLFRIVALTVVQFFADEIVVAVERRYYPEAVGKARSVPFTQELRGSVRSAVRALSVNALALLVASALIFTAIGPAIAFLVANAWLLGRELQDMAWVRHRHSRERTAAAEYHGTPRAGGIGHRDAGNTVRKPVGSSGRHG